MRRQSRCKCGLLLPNRMALHQHEARCPVVNPIPAEVLFGAPCDDDFNGWDEHDDNEECPI